MPIQTDFRPQLHGFDFHNNWDIDDNYRNFLRQKLKDALPIVAKAIITNPGIGFALITALGTAYGLGEALLPGLFDLIVIPILVSQLVDKINSEIEKGFTDSYGACGGMAFASLDYYYKQWAIPKGIFFISKTIDVPPQDNPNASILRNYIFKRFSDSWDSGGVLYKMLEWYIVLKTIPSGIGGEGPEIQKRTKAEWVKLVGLLDQGQPQPIALLFDSWNIFDNHQLVAYGYGGNPSNGQAFINVYDNNNPNLELTINFDFTGAEINGVIVDTSNNRLDTYSNHFLKGFFCTVYSVQTPPTSWGLQQGLNLLPSSCLSVNETFSISGTGENTFQFFQEPHQHTLLTPIISDALNWNIVPPGYQGVIGINAWSTNALNLNVNTTYSQPGASLIFAKVWMTVRDPENNILQDRDGKPLTSIRNLSQLSPQSKSFVYLQVLARLKIVAINRTGDSCFEPYVENSHVTMMIQNQPFGTDPVQYQWAVEGTAVTVTNQPELDLSNLPAAGSTVQLSVTIMNAKSGCIATGTLAFQTYTNELAGRLVAFCHLRKELSTLINPGIINRLGPDDPEFASFVEQHIEQINSAATQIAQLSAKIIQSNRG